VIAHTRSLYGMIAPTVPRIALLVTKHPSAITSILHPAAV
jgi:hypothetical protein